MPLTADEWLEHIQKALNQYFQGAVIQVTIVRSTRVSVRAEIKPEQFLDLFFREETQRIDYALIVNRQRVFGIDNLGGWHEHPLSDPELHLACPEPTPIEAIRRLHEAKQNLESASNV